MSVSHFSAHELGNIAAVVGEDYIPALARFSTANAAAFNSRYAHKLTEFDQAPAYSTEYISKCRPASPDLAAASRSVVLLDYNLTAADKLTLSDDLFAIAGAFLRETRPALEIYDRAKNGR